MSFFTKLFKKLRFRPSKNYTNNIFFLKNSSSLWYTHTKYLHFFLPTKNLSIRHLKTAKLVLKVSKFLLILLIFWIIVLSVF